jgi:hypothetical protein
MGGIRVFGDVEIFLDDTPRVGEEGPVSADAATIFVRLGDVVGTDRDKPAIAPAVGPCSPAGPLS